jgi:transposase
MQVIYERCAAVDVGKDVIAVAVRKPGDGPGGRVAVRRTYKTFYGVLREAARWLMSEGVTHVAMEATGIYSMPCGCREPHPRHATRRYSLIRPPTRACLRTQC